MHSWENDTVAFVGESLNHIHQDTKPAQRRQNTGNTVKHWQRSQNS